MYILDITLINGVHREKNKTENFKAVSLKKSEYTVRYKIIKRDNMPPYSLVVWTFQSKFPFVVLVDKTHDGSTKTFQFSSKKY